MFYDNHKAKTYRNRWREGWRERTFSILLQKTIKSWMKSNRRGKERRNRKTENNKMAMVSPYLSIFTLNVSGLNPPIRRHGMAEWNKKQHPVICCLQETHFSFKDTYGLKVKLQNIELVNTWLQRAHTLGANASHPADTSPRHWNLLSSRPGIRSLCLLHHQELRPTWSHSLFTQNLKPPLVPSGWWSLGHIPAT